MSEGMPVDLQEDGLLWLINRVVFHPRGFALALSRGSDGRHEFSLLGDGSEVWEFTGGIEDDYFDLVKACLDRAAETAPEPEEAPEGEDG